MITTSWHANRSAAEIPIHRDSEPAFAKATAGEVVNSDPLFHLVLRAKSEALLSQVLRISSRLTRAEAYSTADELLDVELAFGSHSGDDSESPPEWDVARFTLHQNQPNPFREATLISFVLPEAAEATLIIHDISGRTLRVIEGEFAKGYNEVPLGGGGLPAGVLFYTLETNEFSDTRKMVLIE